MKKLYTILTLVLLSTLLIACSSDNENEQANNNEPENEVIDNNENNENLNLNENEEDETQNNDNMTDNENNTQNNEEDNEEISDSNKKQVLDRYDDDFRLGDAQEFERSDGFSNDHVEITVNSFKLVDELNGNKPENDHFLLANVTIDNLQGDHNYDIEFLHPIAEDREGGTVQNERDELALELDEEDDGISTGDVVFDIDESDYYRISFFDSKFHLMLIDEQSDED